MAIKVENWPEVPRKRRPLKLFVSENVPEMDTDALRSIGWEIVDVRLLPQDSDALRADALKAQLEGIRQGSIMPDPKKLKFLELEARVYGLHNTKQASERKGDGAEGELDASQLLDGISSVRAFKGTWQGGNYRANVIEKSSSGESDE